MEIFKVLIICGWRKPQNSKTWKFHCNKLLQPFETANNRLQQKFNAKIGIAKISRITLLSKYCILRCVIDDGDGGGGSECNGWGVEGTIAWFPLSFLLILHDYVVKYSVVITVNTRTFVGDYFSWACIPMKIKPPKNLYIGWISNSNYGGLLLPTKTNFLKNLTHEILWLWKSIRLR